MSLIHKPTLLTGDAYARDLVKSINKAKARILLLTTIMRDDDPRSHDIVEALIAAAERNVEISICVDTFTYLEPKEFILRFPKRQPARAVQAVKLERRLKKHGIKFHWLGQRASLLITGRTHSKWSIVDDVVYSFGGVNLDNESFNNTDYLIRFHDANLADHLAGEQSRIRKADQRGGALRSHIRPIDNQTKLLVDGGLLIDSVIYRRACELAKTSKRAVFVSQYCPTGNLNRQLKRQNAKLYFNHWRQAFWVNRLLITLGTLTAKQDTLYKRSNYLHAKFIIFTMPDKSQVAISGSHNFMYGSGAIGTKEVAIETTDPRLIKQLTDFYKDYVA